MVKKIYSFEVFGLRNKRLGEVSDQYLTKKEMIMFAQGMLQGACILRTTIFVKVREKDASRCCYEIKS